MDDKNLYEGIGKHMYSPNEADRNGEVANVVDGLFFIGRAIHELASEVGRSVDAAEEGNRIAERKRT